MTSALKTVPYYHHLERQLDPEQLLHYPSVGQLFSRLFNAAYENAQQVCLTSSSITALYIVQFRDSAGRLCFTFAPAFQIAHPGNPNNRITFKPYQLNDICAVVRTK